MYTDVETIVALLIRHFITEVKTRARIDVWLKFEDYNGGFERNYHEIQQYSLEDGVWACFS